jgi:hypothetical protein
LKPWIRLGVTARSVHPARQPGDLARREGADERAHRTCRHQAAGPARLEHAGRDDGLLGYVRLCQQHHLPRSSVKLGHGVGRAPQFVAQGAPQAGAGHEQLCPSLIATKQLARVKSVGVALFLVTSSSTAVFASNTSFARVDGA